MIKKKNEIEQELESNVATAVEIRAVLNKEIKKCPFCGGESELEEVNEKHTDYFQISCINCGGNLLRSYETSFQEDFLFLEKRMGRNARRLCLEDIIIAWNKRV